MPKIYDPITDWEECMAWLEANQWEPVPYTAEELKDLSNHPRTLFTAEQIAALNRPSDDKSG